MSEGKRGRPIGSSPTQAVDDIVLRQAARRIYLFGGITATGFFKEALEKEEQTGKVDPACRDAILRRLQRRWQRDGGRFLAECEAGWGKQRWELEAKTLKAEAPELFALVDRFASSPDGQSLLADYGVPGRPVHPLSLGLVRLWELIQQAAPLGASAAEAAFVSIYVLWSRFGVEPDAAFLTQMGELCLAKAAEVRANSAGSSAAGETETAP